MGILKNTWFRIVLVLAVVGIAGWRFTLPSDSSVDIPVADVMQGSLTMTLEESGELRAKRSATITAPNDKLITYLAPTVVGTSVGTSRTITPSRLRTTRR